MVVVADAEAIAVAPVTSTSHDNRCLKNEFQWKSLCSICLQSECRSDMYSCSNKYCNNNDAKLAKLLAAVEWRQVWFVCGWQVKLCDLVMLHML